MIDMTPLLHRIVPDGRSLMPYQAKGVGWLALKRNSILADEMGLGKTVQVCALINMLGLTPSLIVCPASLKLQWARELSAWCPQLTVELVNPKVAFPTNADVVIINYDILHKFRHELRLRPWPLLVFDEAHYLKNRGTRRTREAFGGGRPGTSKHVSQIPSGKMLLLTGTPLSNRPRELWALLHRIDPDEWPRFHPWAMQFCDAHRDRFGWDYDGASNLPELRESLVPVMLRRTKADVLPDLPEKRHVTLAIDPSGHESLIRREIELHDLVEGPHSPDISEMAAVRHELGLAKIPFIVEHLQSYADAGVPVVCFCHHLEVLHGVRDGFPGAMGIEGASTAINRQRAVDRFQASECNILLGQIQAAGVGLNLQRSSNVVFGEMDWVPGVLDQASDRCHRIGTTRGVLVEYLCFDRSFDARMADKIVTKRRVIDAVLTPSEVIHA